MRRDIEFRSEGVMCRGWLYTPRAGTGGAGDPTVVMAHGFSAVKEMGLDRFAEAFAAGGVASLVFDYRGLGASDGEPRQDLDPYAQLTDYRNAISFARRLAEVDPNRIGVWGSSYSGGHAIMLGALDRRVKAVVAQVPLIDAWEGLRRSIGTEGLALVEQQQIAERERLYAGAAPLMMPVVSTDGAGALASPDSAEWFLRLAPQAPTWRNEVTLRSVGRVLEYSPARWIDRVAPTPLLVLVAESDALCPIALTCEAFARAGEPKRLRILAVGHFDVYDDPHFGTAVQEATDWFRQHLAR